MNTRISRGHKRIGNSTGPSGGRAVGDGERDGRGVSAVHGDAIAENDT